MTIFEFFALFSFTYIFTITIVVFIGIHKRKRAINDIDEMTQKFNREFINYENKKDC